MTFRTEHFDVIYPAGAEESARYAAALAEVYYTMMEDTMPVRRPYRYPLILSFSGMDRNGMVSDEVAELVESLFDHPAE